MGTIPVGPEKNRRPNPLNPPPPNPRPQLLGLFPDPLRLGLVALATSPHFVPIRRVDPQPILIFLCVFRSNLEKNIYGFPKLPHGLWT